MLNVDKLKNEIANAIKTIIVPAIETMELNQLPTGKLSEKMAKDKAKVFDDLVTEQFSEILANAIHSYIKNANIIGNIITVGSPTTQTATISPAATPSIAGAIPNTFGIK